MTDPTPPGESTSDGASTRGAGPVDRDAASQPPERAGSTRVSPDADADAEPRPSRLERAKDAYDLVSDVLTPQTLFILLAAAIIGITGLLGGWNNIATVDKELPQLHVGEQVRAEPFELTVTGARVVEEFKPFVLKDYAGRDRYVLVAFALTNTSKLPVLVGDLDETLVPEDASLRSMGGTGPMVYRTLDTRFATSFQPGMPARYVAVWQQAKTEPLPTELTFRIEKRTYRQSSISGDSKWTDGEPMYTLTVPVEAS